MNALKFHLFQTYHGPVQMTFEDKEAVIDFLILGSIRAYPMFRQYLENVN